MRLNILVELTNDIKKLAALEESIIDEDFTGSYDLRSKQAVLISEVIQSLQRIQNNIKVDTYSTVAEYSNSFSRN